MNRKAIGTRLKEARLKKGLTQEALAELADTGPTYICDIERGTKFPSMALYIRLINALDVSSDFILQGEINAGKPYRYHAITNKLDQLTPQQQDNVAAMIDAYIKTLQK